MNYATMLIPSLLPVSSIWNENVGFADTTHTHLLMLAVAMVNFTIIGDTVADSKPLGHIFIELFGDSSPKTAEKFCVLKTSKKGSLLSQNYSKILIPGWQFHML